MGKQTFMLICVIVYCEFIVSEVNSASQQVFLNFLRLL